MLDLEKFAKQLGRDSLIEKLRTKEQNLPCAYGGGDCIISYARGCFVRENGEIGKVVQGAYCLRVRQVKWKFLESKASHAKRLEQAGCPNTEYGFFGWECKYADGKFHDL